MVKTRRAKRKVPEDEPVESTAAPGPSYAKAFKGVREAATFTPTWEEFKDLRVFLKREDVQEAGMRCGIIKIKGPEEWAPTDAVTFADRSKRPISVMKQAFSKAQDGCFHLVRQDSVDMLPGDWKTASEEETTRLEKTYRAKGGKGDVYAKYWATREQKGLAAMYAADVPGSVMKPGLEHWNLGSKNLPCLTRTIDAERRVIPGVTSPYLYFGAFGTTFGFHTEDADLYSINYLHEGESKEWTAVPPAYGEKMENVVKGLFRYGDHCCAAFMREKSHIIRPDVLLRHRIPVFSAKQEKGDIIVTFPYAYHGGFNSGMNVAEARNIALNEWIKYGLAARSCLCKGVKCSQNPLPRALVEEMADKCDHPDYYRYRTFRAANGPNVPYPHPNQSA